MRLRVDASMIASTIVVSISVTFHRFWRMVFFKLLLNGKAVPRWNPCHSGP